MRWEQIKLKWDLNAKGVKEVEVSENSIFLVTICLSVGHFSNRSSLGYREKIFYKIWLKEKVEICNKNINNTI